MRLISYLPIVYTVAAMAIDAPSPVVEKRATYTLSPAEEPRIGELRSRGCFSSKGSLVDPNEENPKSYDKLLVTQGFCRDDVCKGYKVMATKDYHCYCGDKYPTEDTKVEDDKCDFACPSYNLQTCGGIKGGKSYFSVFNTGVDVVVEYEEAVASTESETPSSSSTPALETETSESSSKANVGGIAAGVVVGIAAVAGICVGVWFYSRRKRNQEIEDEHRRNAAIGGFMGHKPGSSGGISITDARLDPGMVQRRLSDGSIADNQDYSRKILRVTNA